MAIVLALAEIFQQNGKFDRDLIIALFDAEEPPYFQTPSMGSNRFFEDQMDTRGVSFALIYDLVGHDVSVSADMIPGIGKLMSLLPGKRNPDVGIPVFAPLVFMTGAESHGDLPRVVEAAGIPNGLKLLATLNTKVGDMSDHGIFRKNGVPYLFLSCGRWAHYHMPTDTPDRLNYKKMARITDLSVRLLNELDGEVLDTSTGETDTARFESRVLRKAAGPLYRPLLKWVGLKKIETREEMDRFVDKLLNLGL